MRSNSLLSETSVFLTSGGESSEFSFVVFFRDDPVDSWVSLNGVMVWINADNFEEFVGGILTNPVRVKDSHVGASSTNLLFSNRSVCHVKLKRFESALEDAEECVRLDPSWFKVRIY